MTFAETAAREAVDRLGLLKPNAAHTIARLLANDLTEHPRAICTRYRKEGEQITAEEKKALGIKANGFLSRDAYNELTASGRKEPLKAHETTLLRATFAMMRKRTVDSCGQFASFGSQFKGLKYDVLVRDCPACLSMANKVVPPSEAQVFAHKGCICDTANYSFRPEIDFLADLD